MNSRHFTILAFAGLLLLSACAPREDVPADNSSAAPAGPSGAHQEGENNSAEETANVDTPLALPNDGASPSEINTGVPKPTAPYRRLEIVQVEDVTVLAFVDREFPDDQDIYEMSQELKRFVADHDSPRVLLDLRAVESLSDAAMGTLIIIKKQVEAKSGQIKLCNINSEIMALFKVIRLDSVFEIHDDAAAGLKAFHASAQRPDGEWPPPITDPE